ncbi:MAG: methyltransferase domain-containing protein [Candidatus Limnocylindrales bacterium]
MFRLLACPACRGDLRWDATSASCSVCGRAFPIEDGIPILLVSPETADHDDLEHLDAGGAQEHKARQAVHFDEAAAAEFEIERPSGAPRLYGWLLAEKFRRATSDLAGELQGATTLVVCGGSGMDAEFLTRSGAQVMTSDISLGAARRARERALRRGLDYLSVVADIEALPFRDEAVEIVFVHDGLHHLEQPLAGLREMARVARRAVSITEPAQAVATAMAVRVGLALEREEAGNRVARLRPQDVAAELEARSFQVRRAGRYAMYYRHRPGRVFAWLSQPAVLPFATTYWRVGNALIGRIGNKMTVVAERSNVTR